MHDATAKEFIADCEKLTIFALEELRTAMKQAAEMYSTKVYFIKITREIELSVSEKMYEMAITRAKDVATAGHKIALESAKIVHNAAVKSEWSIYKKFTDIYKKITKEKLDAYNAAEDAAAVEYGKSIAQVEVAYAFAMTKAWGDCMIAKEKTQKYIKLFYSTLTAESGC